MSAQPLPSDDQIRREVLTRIAQDRAGAHTWLFSKRRSSKSPPFHADLLNQFYSTHPREIMEAFRGAAKSTLSEEGMLVKAGLQEYKYGVILGNTYDMACKRLASIKREIDQNPYIQLAFGDLKGPVWNEGRVELGNGTVIQAYGARQSIRGAKESVRPDFVLIDDLEDQDWVRSDAAIAENMAWLMSDFLPALENPLTTPIRYIGTPLAENSLLMQLARDPAWHARVYPARYEDAQGQIQPMWPDKFPLEMLDEIERLHTRLGKHREFVQEYLCQASNSQTQVFTPQMLRCEPRIRTWQATYAMIDPARTANAKTSATTGWAVWSWEGSRLTVWEADGQFLKPDEIVDLAFRINDKFHPVELGFEEDGLNEWGLQPLRAAMASRGALPLRALKAPRGKLDFIQGLQPFAQAGDLVFAGDRAQFEVALGQFLGFPKPRIDIPNALAYALVMRAGAAFYPDFAPECVVDGLDPMPQEAAWLALNADGSRTAAVLVQDVLGTLRVIADKVIDGPAAEAVPPLLRAMGALARGRLRIVVPQAHFDPYRNVGLVQAVNRAGAQANPGFQGGAEAVKGALRARIRALPGLLVSTEARWTLNALAGGYARAILPGNTLAPEATKGVYRTLMEGVEALAGLVASDRIEREEPGNFKQTIDGRRYRSALKQ